MLKKNHNEVSEPNFFMSNLILTFQLTPLKQIYLKKAPLTLY